MEESRKFINELIYLACDGRVSDIKALEKESTYMEFCQILDSYLEKVERQNKEIEKARNATKTATKAGRRR